MVTRREFNKIKKENPESRIGQRTWEQQKYRNRLYKNLNKGLNKSDADAIVAKENFDKERNTWEYVSSEYWTTQESAKSMIKNWYFDFVKEHIDAFPEFDNEFAIWLVKGWYWELVADNFDKFVGLNKNFAMSVLKNLHGNTIHLGHPPKFYPYSWDSSYDLCVWNKLCELIVENANKILNLDKEFVDWYMNFYNRYESYDIDYGPNPCAYPNRYNSLMVLAKNIKSIEWVDEAYLLDYLVRHLHDESCGHQGEFDKLSKRLLDNTDIKFSEDVFHFLSGNGWLCSYLERFEFEKLPKDYLLEHFSSILEDPHSLDKDTEKELLGLIKYIQNHLELWITVDDLFWRLYEQGMEFNWKYHVRAAWKLVKILPHISVSKEVILKVFNLIVTHIPIGYNDHLDDYGLFDSLSKFESYIINHPELDISSIDLYYVSRWWDPAKKDVFYEPYKPNNFDTIAWYKASYNGLRDPNQHWYFNTIFKNLIWVEKVRVAVEEQKKLAQENDRIEKQEKEWRENIHAIVDNSYEDWINVFLSERNDEHKNYIKNLLLEIDIQWQVLKESFSKLYNQLSSEDQKILLKKFKRIKLV